MSDNRKPFWQRPLPPIRRPGDPLADAEMSQSITLSEDIDPLAEPLAIPSSNGTVDPLADDPLAETPASDVIHPLPDAASPVNLPGAVAKAAAEASGDALPPPLSVVEAQRRLVDSQMRCARATEAQGLCRGEVALALAAFQRVAMVVQTQSDLIRQHIESENQLRADRAAGKIAPRGGQRRLGSAIDSFAYHTRAMGRGAGGGAAFRRGARPGSARTPK
jgi:hypothetical protein